MFSSGNTYLRVIYIFLLLLLFQNQIHAEDTLVVTSSRAWPPYSFIGEDGEPQGMLVEFWREFGMRNDVGIRFKQQNWSDTLEELKSGECDIHAGLFHSSERDAYLDFSMPINITIAACLFVSKDQDRALYKSKEEGRNRISSL